jgi:undecaprenyl diphosphate synthase
MEKATENNSGLLLNIALNYGGRDEVVRAVKEIAQEVKEGKMQVEDICEDDISKRTYTAAQPDPDLIIRPSGEYRLSNFFLWQSAYSELWFSNILWPDFSNEDLLQAIYDYQKRTRRFGGV